MKEISYDELNILLELHNKWLRHENGGKRLILNRVDLSNMVLADRNFSRAVAIGADFRGADISNCNFREANLSDSDISYCNIVGADFSGAIMSNTKKVGINIGGGYKSEIRTISDMLDYGEMYDKMDRDKESHEINEDDIEAIDRLANEKIANELVFEDPFEEDEDEW